MTFKIKKYQVIKNAISYELANFVYNYFMLKRDAVNFMYKNNINYETPLLGTWEDKQVPNTYSHYADFVMETLLMKMLPVMKKETGLDLIPTYSYSRAYKKGDILKRHKDRPSCEISTTLNLGGSKWPIYLEPSGKKGKRGPADAQTGNVPMPQFKTLVKDYTGESYDYNIPQVGSKLDSKYWSKYLDNLVTKTKNGNGKKFDFGNL